MAEQNAHEPSREHAQERREECRRKVRAWLYERTTIAAHPKQIQRGLNAGHDHDFTLPEIDSALAFLLGVRPEQVSQVRDEIGATSYYQITSAGSVAHERDPLA